MGYQARKSGVRIDLIQAKLGYRFLAVTKRYIGISPDKIHDGEDAVCL